MKHSHSKTSAYGQLGSAQHCGAFTLYWDSVKYESL